MSDVPCNGCTACCKRERIILRPEDDPTQYLTVPTRKGSDGQIELMLAHKHNGDCIYLGEHGCAIHGRAPAACREFDCRVWLASFSDQERAALIRDIDKDVAIAASSRPLAL